MIDEHKNLTPSEGENNENVDHSELNNSSASENLDSAQSQPT